MTILRRFLGYVRPYAGHMALAVVLLALAGGLASLVVATLKPLVNQVLQLQPPPTDSAATAGIDLWLERLIPGSWLSFYRARPYAAIPLIMVVAFLLRALCLYVGTYLLTASGARVIRDLRASLYRSMVHQSLPFFRAHPSGELLSRLLNDVQRLQRVSTDTLANSVRVGAMVPFMLVVIIAHDWRMAFFVLVVLPLMVLPMVRLSRRLRRASRRSQETTAEVASLASETVGGIKVVQGFGMEGFEIHRFRHALERLLRVDLRAARAAALAPSVIEVVGAISGGSLFYVAGLGIAAGWLDAGDFVVVIGGLGMLLAALRILTRSNVEIQQALAAAERIFEVMDQPATIEDTPGAVTASTFSHEIRFEGVDFAYQDEEDETVLRGIDLVIPKGEIVALVGPSGAGKSTLVNLIPRFQDPTQGRITLDGRDLRSLTLASLREQIGLVTQETVLFDATVRENIAYGRADVPLERVEEVARAAHASAFIEALPQGYDTLLGEHGMRLSMGQRQRLAIARALLKDPPILLLDEATSALDAESEALVQRALDVLLEGRTSIVIAHRLATIRQAHRILALDGGRIVEQGPHHELLERKGLYARLYDLQFRQADVETADESTA